MLIPLTPTRPAVVWSLFLHTARRASTVTVLAAVRRITLLAVVLPACLAAQEFSVTPLVQPRPKDPTYALPLAPTRTVRFTTDEGTWMSVDISPDGTTILFDLLGDLYTVPITGGKATRIMGGMALDVQPRYSPDGRQIVFVSDRSGQDNLWVADADGQYPRPVAAVGLDTSSAWNGGSSGKWQPTWTPDGRFIIADGTRYDAATGVASKIPELQGEVAFGSSAREAYVAWEGLDEGGISVYDFTAGRARALLRSARPVLRPAVSRDYRWLVYGTVIDRTTSLRLRDLRTGVETWLARDLQPAALGTKRGFGKFPNFAFTPDNQAIVVTTGGKLWRVEIPSGQRTLIPFQADVELDLGPLSQFQYSVPDSITVRQIREPRLSPDGTRLAFIALDKLYLMDFPHGTPRRATTANGVVENYPAWSPDGRYVAFSTYSDLAGGHIYRVEAARVLTAGRRAKPERLTREADLYTRLAYTPDGQRLVFGRSPWRELQQHVERTPKLPVDLLWMEPDGDVARPITRITDGWNAEIDAGAPPQFLPTQPDRIVVPCLGALVSMRWDGSQRRTLLQWPAATSFAEKKHSTVPAQALLSPDGTHALVVYQNNLYLATLPPGQTDLLRPIVGATPPSVPLRRISRNGAEFPAWSADGKRIYFALGRSLFVYDIATGTGPERHDVNVVVARGRAHGALALRGGRLITMNGDDVIERGDIIIRDNRIVAVGPSGTVGVPKDARTIDVAGKTILPGYVDIHAHMLGPYNTHKTQLPQYLAYLAYGVTTTRNPSSQTHDWVAYADRVDAGDILGPRVLTTGPRVDRYYVEPLSSLDATRRVLRRYAEFYQTGTVKQYHAGNRRVRQWIIMASHELGLSPTTEGAGDFKMSLTEMIDGYAGHEHGYEVFPLYRDVALLAAASGITYTPTLVVGYVGGQSDAYQRFITEEDPHNDPKLRRFFDHTGLDARLLRATWRAAGEYLYPEGARSAGKIVAAGGRVGVGAHGELHGLGTHWELWMLGSGGLSNLEILHAGTLAGARAIGLDRDLGSLEPGKIADLQVLDGNPLKNVRHTNTIRYVMKDGRLYDATTLDELWPRQRKLQSQWWQLAEPPDEIVRASW